MLLRMPSETRTSKCAPQFCPINGLRAAPGAGRYQNQRIHFGTNAIGGETFLAELGDNAGDERDGQWTQCVRNGSGNTNAENAFHRFDKTFKGFGTELEQIRFLSSTQKQSTCRQFVR